MMNQTEAYRYHRQHCTGCSEYQNHMGASRTTGDKTVQRAVESTEREGQHLPASTTTRKNSCPWHDHFILDCAACLVAAEAGGWE